jgi:hypothetical protein
MHVGRLKGGYAYEFTPLMSRGLTFGTDHKNSLKFKVQSLKFKVQRIWVGQFLSGSVA